MSRLTEIVAGISQERNQNVRIDYGKFSRSYLKQLPGHLAEITGGAIAMQQFQQQLANGVLTAEILHAAMKIVETGSPERSTVFWETALPLIISMTSVQKLENHPESFKRAIRALSEGANAGRLTFMTPLCPPYNYKADANGLISHADGTIHSTVGTRFSPVLETMAQPLSKLVEAGVGVDFLFATYSGRTNNRADLVEMGIETIQHYGEDGTPELMERLRLAFGDMEQQAGSVLGSYGIGAECIGLDEHFGQEINQKVGEISPIVIDLMGPSHLFEYRRPEIECGLAGLGLNVTADMLRFFVNEESLYRSKHEGLINPAIAEPVLTTALKQSMLYDSMLQLATARGAVIWNLENASNYMGRCLELGNYAVPVLMARPYDPRTPDYRFNLRQPFNPPVMQ